MEYEKVYTVNNYWDGPIEGVANYMGEPHKFKLLFDQNKDDYSTDYELQKISEKEFNLILQSWRIWLKWNNKKERTKEEFDSHPVLPKDRVEYENIEAQIRELVESNDSNKFKVKGSFKRLGSEQHDFEVLWSAEGKD